MPSHLENALPIVAMWGSWILLTLLALAALLIWRLGHGRRFLLPARWPARVASLGALSLALLASAGLYCLAGPLRPMLEQVRSIEGAVGRRANDVDFRQVADQSPGRLSALRGKVVLVNLWATWCGPCRRELPEINRLQRAYADQGLVVVTLSNEERERLLRFAAKYPFTTLNVYATRLGWLDVPGRPISMVIDRAGVVRQCLIGAQSYSDLSESVERVLRARS